MLITAAFEEHEHWCDGVRAAFVALLSFFDAEPRLARVWLVESLAAGAWALEWREQHLQALTRSIVEHWRPPVGAESHPLAAESVMASALGVLQAHLLARRPGPLIVLLGPLMGIATASYLDSRGVAEEIERAEALTHVILAERDALPSRDSASLPAAAAERPGALENPRAHRARRCLRYLAEHPGASNREIATAIGIASQAQISTLLARLVDIGLLHKHPGRPGHPNAWSLTPYGRQALDEHTNYSRRLPREFTVKS